MFRLRQLTIRIGTNLQTHMNVLVTSTISGSFVWIKRHHFGETNDLISNLYIWNRNRSFSICFWPVLSIFLQIIQTKNLTFEPQKLTRMAAPLIKLTNRHGDLHGKFQGLFLSLKYRQHLVDFPSGDFCSFAEVDVFFQICQDSLFATRCCWVFFREEPKRCL